ncbi:MAG TPA: hypothetical protein VMR97_12040 [Acidimicrobiales bacterium]|nr:hypothetical protein [Acidimicrobiales bacterium]
MPGVVDAALDVDVEPPDGLEVVEVEERAEPGLVVELCVGREAEPGRELAAFFGDVHDEHTANTMAPRRGEPRTRARAA